MIGLTILFTGKAGATSYSYGGKTLQRGDTAPVDSVDEKGKPTGHWAALLKTGNAELVKE
jgi:hypothetical protein